MKRIVDIPVVDLKGHYEDERQCFFINSTSVHGFHAFVEYRTLSGKDDAVKASIRQPAHLDSLEKTMLTSLEQRE